MGEFDAISAKYHQAGISLDNIEYAVTAVKFGSSPEHILENLKVGHNALNDEQASALLSDLFIANVSETKRRKRVILALAVFYSVVGFVCSYYLLHVLIFGGVLHRAGFVILGAVAGIIIGFFNFSKLLKVKTRIYYPNLAHK